MSSTARRSGKQPQPGDRRAGAPAELAPVAWPAQISPAGRRAACPRASLVLIPGSSPWQAPGACVVDGLQCLGNEQLAFHIHARRPVFDHGVARSIPCGVGIEGRQTMSTPEGTSVDDGGCFYWLHTTA